MSGSKDLFEELESISVREVFQDNQCRIEIENRAPSEWEVYIYGACEFVFSDGSTTRDNQLRRHYTGDTVRWQSNSSTKCVQRVNIALIAKSHRYPDEGKYALADEVPSDQCIIERGWYFGKNKSIGVDDQNFEGRFILKTVD
jgi:hypothetical protein